MNGLSGELPSGADLSTRPGQYNDWSLGLNFSVPLGLRTGRAQVRQQNLMLVRDRANIEQQLHLVIHQLAQTVRNLDSAYEQYLAFKETRIAADINLKVQNEKFRTGQTIYLNVLQALNDWGTAVSSEAQQLLIYNTTLATLEQETGTILETHGLVFAEERFRLGTTSAPPPIPLRPAAGRFAATVPQHGIAVGEFVQLAESGCARRENTWRAVAAAAVGLNP